MSKEERLRTTSRISILCSPGPLRMHDALFCFVSIPVSGYYTVYLKEVSRRETRRKEDSKVETLIGDIGIFFYLPKQNTRKDQNSEENSCRKDGGNTGWSEKMLKELQNN